ncbi:Sorbin and SH3 domain-containing protein 1 [Liparis tanakae]|uniref:Sorbin and SH3 domain-containing protein 1 n=1 Tax=Liparis tanakae TaxID=230148 RepID=A0A4Z2ET33_9TELE|nr:Sorbin and SH3 domain-containing protein 1 [Liparis tanakae]
MQPVAHVREVKPHVAHVREVKPHVAHVREVKPHVAHVREVKPHVAHVHEVKPHVAHVREVKPHVAHVREVKPHVAHVREVKPHVAHVREVKPQQTPDWWIDSSPVLGESPDDVLRRRHGDKEKVLEEQRRLKREQEEADTASRRHTGIVPTHHQFITNERFGDLLNVTDNADKRKSGVEVRGRVSSFCKQEASGEGGAPRSGEGGAPRSGERRHVVTDHLALHVLFPRHT